MKKIRLLPLLFFMLLPPLAAESLYVQSAKGKVMAEPSFRAKLITTLSKGTKVNVLETKKRWVKIQTDETTGWFSRFLVKSERPLEKVTVFTGQASEMKGQIRRRASTAQAAGATRGLTADSRQRREAQSHLNYQSLQKIEQFKISKEELERFTVGGQL